MGWLRLALFLTLSASFVPMLAGPPPARGLLCGGGGRGAQSATLALAGALAVSYARLMGYARLGHTVYAAIARDFCTRGVGRYAPLVALLILTLLDAMCVVCPPPRCKTVSMRLLLLNLLSGLSTVNSISRTGLNMP